MKAKAILLVDADGDCEELVGAVADEHGWDLRWVKTSREAFQLLSRRFPIYAFVVVDVDPGAHGLALLEAISACAESAPMIVLTGLEEGYMGPVAREHGATACLGKPIHPGKFASIFRHAVAHPHLISDPWGHLLPLPIHHGAELRAGTRAIAQKLSPTVDKARKKSSTGNVRRVRRSRKVASRNE